MKCSICKQEGHNKRSCKSIITPVSAEKIEAETDVNVEPVVKVKMTSQSKGLSKRLTQMNVEGRRLNDDSCSSEKTLSNAICEIQPYLEEKCKSFGGKLIHKKTISLFECQEYFHKSGGPPPDDKNKNVSMKPDGGIFIMELNNNKIPILIIEDKIQGTNDTLYEQKKKRQATGNAIERGAKNIRGAEMIFSGLDFFSYIMFASGCDFHHTETISKRIEMMNMGFPNHYIGLKANTSQEEVNDRINTIIQSINIKKRIGKSVASVFVKAHKYDEMKHGSSVWKKEEIIVILKKVIDEVFVSLTPSLKPNT